MDLQSALICGAVFVFSAAVLLFISWIGIKQKSYEEAIAEQRDLNSGLLETKSKFKLAREKKLRKQEKRKNKASATSSSSETTSDETVQTTPDLPKAEAKTGAKIIPTIIVKNHNQVDFKEQPALIPPVLTAKVGRKSKREQSIMSVKPILINREPSPVITIDSPKIMNHFELIHPKDEKELHKNQIVEKNVKSAKKVKKSKVVEETVTDNDSTPEKSPKPNKHLQKPSDKSNIDTNKIKSNISPKAKNDSTQEKSKSKENEKTKNIKLDKLNGAQKTLETDKKSTTVDKKKQSPQPDKNKKEATNKDSMEKNKVEVVKEITTKQDKTLDNKKPQVNNNKKAQPAEKKKGQTQNPEEKKDSIKIENVPKKKDVPESAKKETITPEKPKKNKKEANPLEKEQNNTQEKRKINGDKVKKEQNGLDNGYPEMIEESMASVIQTTTAKESKKRKRELNALHQMSKFSLGGDYTGVNVSLLVPLIRKAELSRSEVQILIDLLLNKQLDAPMSHEEWFDGRSDPVVKLKKQLAERIKLFEAEQEAHAGVAAKLREVRSELNSCLQAKRQIEEVNAHALNERQQIITRLQMNQEHWQAEKQMFQKQIQQLQGKLTEEKHMARQFKEEHSKLQSQRQQLEVAVNRLSDQHQESDKALKSQIGSLHNELQDQRNVAASLRLDLHAVGTDADALRERLAILQPAAEQAQELARQLEEARRTISELEQRLTVTVNNAQGMNEQLNHLEETKNNAQAEVINLQTELSRLHSISKQKQDENETLLAKVRAELTTVQANANGSAENDKARQVEILNLHNELDSTRIELKATRDEVEEQKAKNNELREKSWKVIEALKTAEKAKEDGRQLLNDTISKLKIENQEQNKQLLLRLFPEVSVSSSLKYDTFISDYEKAVHNFISSKTIDIQMKSQQTVNKLKEQLATTEKDSQKKIKDLEEKLRLETAKLTNYEQSNIKQLKTKELEFQKKLKDIEVKQKLEVGNNSDKDKKLVEAKKEIASLNETVTKYKTIIENTENMLSKLEKNIGSEVTTMKAELITKEDELKLRTILTQNQQKEIQQLKEGLLAAQQQNQILLEKCQKLKSSESLTNSFQNHHQDIKEQTCKMVAVEQIKIEDIKQNNSISPEKLKAAHPDCNVPFSDSNESKK